MTPDTRRAALVPLVELHVHLEGAIPHPALWELIQKYGGDPAVPDQEALNRRFRYRDFPHFIETWVWKNRFLREYEDFTFIAERAALELRSQNIAYAEAHYAPSSFAETGLEVKEITRAIRAGLNRAPGIEIVLIADLIRNLGPEGAARTLREVEQVRELGVVGVGLGGSEHQYPPELFQGVFAAARRSGFHATAHAGEAVGPASIWGAIRRLGVERIGHGTRAEEDESLLEYLSEKQIPLEMCPLSNVRTGVVGRIEDHPIRRYFDRGLLVTVNTDDPKMFGNTLAEEYRLLETVFGFTPGEIETVRRNAILASWMEPARKARMLGATAQAAAGV
ncbi:MAG: adenosine deaminase [Anaerolineales bacterium]|nr:adenosine deaminase [Anaerolineales bacterium]